MYSENFANIAKISLCEIFAIIANFRYGSEIFAMIAKKFRYSPLFCLLILFRSLLFHPNFVLGVFGTVGKLRECRIQKYPEITLLKFL